MSERQGDSAWSRLSDRLQANADDDGAIRGYLPLPRVLLIWLAANLVVTTMLTGTLFVPGVKWQTALMMIVVGTVVGALALAAIGNIGTRTGLATMALTRGSFGSRGSLLPVAANVIILMGWSWVQAMLAGITVNYLVEQATGFSNPILFSMLCQAVVVALAIFGHEGIAKAEPWFALIILLAMAWVLSKALTAFSVADFTGIPVDPDAGMSAMVVLDIVIATAVSWTVLSADINRLAKDSQSGVLGSISGYVLSTVAAMALGATAIGYVILRGDEALPFDPPTVVAAFGVPLAVVIVLSVMATNTMVVYGMTNSVIHAGRSGTFHFLPTALVLGAISVLGTIWQNLLYSFTDFLVMIGAFFVPVFAIMIVDYYLVHRGVYTRDVLRDNGGRYWYTAGVNPAAIAAWLAGAATSYILTYVVSSPIGATIPAFIVAFLLYLAWGMTVRRDTPPDGPQIHLAEEVRDAR
ncbi:purine-cytosine permease family protein [Actinomycetota bacterium]